MADNMKPGGRITARPVWADVAIKMDDGTARDATIHRAGEIEQVQKAIEP